MRKKITQETALKKAVIQLLKIHKIYNFPLVASIGSPPGLPDRIAIKDGRLIAIEFKANGRPLSEYQEKIRTEIEDSGGLYIVCRSIEDVIEGLQLPGRLF